MSTIEKFVWDSDDVEWRNSGAKDFDEHLHPRDEHGRWSDVGALGNEAVRAGGFSVNTAGDNPRSGWMVSQKGTEQSFSLESLGSEQEMEFVPGNPWVRNTAKAIETFVGEHGDDLDQPGTYLGGWVDNGRLYLDVSHNIEDEAAAGRYAQENDQLAIYNAGSGEYRRFDEEMPRAAARGPVPEAKAEKIFLSVEPDTDFTEMAQRMLYALFGGV